MESIRILQDTYEKLYAITPLLGDLIEEEFKNISKYWREDYVTPFLQQKGLIKNEWEHLYEFDSYYLLELLKKYWQQFSTLNSKFFSKEEVRSAYYGG